MVGPVNLYTMYWHFLQYLSLHERHAAVGERELPRPSPQLGEANQTEVEMAFGTSYLALELKNVCRQQ